MASPTATPSPSPSSPRWHCYHWCTGTAFNFNDYFGIGDLPTSDPLSSDSSSIYSFIGSDAFVVLCGVFAALLIVLCYCACCRGARRGVVESTECAVCLDEFTEEENLRWMPNCQHAFHPPCIDAWLRSHSDCPICRAPITGPPLPSAPPLVVSPVIFQGAGDV